MATQNSGMSVLSSLEATLQEYMVDKAPFQLPKGLKELLVTFAPWFIIVFSLAALPGILSLIGVGSMMGPYMMRYGSPYSFGPLLSISLVILAISVILQLMALPGLFAKKMQGWKYIFYAQLISIVASALQSMNFGGIIGVLITTTIGFYILFQVKEMYK